MNIRCILDLQCLVPDSPGRVLVASLSKTIDVPFAPFTGLAILFEQFETPDCIAVGASILSDDCKKDEAEVIVSPIYTVQSVTFSVESGSTSVFIRDVYDTEQEFNEAIRILSTEYRFEVQT